MTYKDLCDFAHLFPRFAADLLEAGSTFRRNTREETVTDLIMVGLKQFERFGIRVDFPQDESITGQDMDWEFVAPRALNGRRYVRLHIQAKRAKLNSIKNPYWWYPEIDHASPKGALKGTQHESLIDNADPRRGCIPLYMFYHPLSALKSSRSGVPAIEGVNIFPAELISKKTSSSVWPRHEKKVETFRPNFSPLSLLLCHLSGRTIRKYAGGSVPADYLNTFVPTPGEIVDKLNERYQSAQLESDIAFETSDQIPDATNQVMTGQVAVRLERPRALFVNKTDFGK